MRVRPSSGATSYRFFVPVAEYHSDRRRTSSPKTTPARSMYFCVVLKSECPAIRMIASGDIPARRVRVSRPAVSFLETATARIVSTSTGAYACRVSADTGEAKLPPTTTPTARAARRPQQPPIPQADPLNPPPAAQARQNAFYTATWPLRHRDPTAAVLLRVVYTQGRR
jgi:hypothetical protein